MEIKIDSEYLFNLFKKELDKTLIEILKSVYIDAYQRGYIKGSENGYIQEQLG